MSGDGVDRSAGFVLAALGTVALAAGGAALVADQYYQWRREEERRKRPVRRSPSLSTTSYVDHRQRGPIKLPLLNGAIQCNDLRDPLLLGLDYDLLLMVLPYLHVSTCLSLRAVCRRWNEVWRSAIHYKPYIKAAVWRGDLNGLSRFRYWITLLDANERLAQSSHLYCQLMNDDEDPFDVDDTVARIRRDISRTLPEADLFRTGSGAEALRRVLSCCAIIDPNVGYCQGMNYIAGYLLTQTMETMSFAFMDIILHDYQYRWVFAPGLPHLRLCLYQLEQMIAMYLPDLHKHFTTESVEGELYASEWFISLFTYTFDITDVGRIWDLFLLSGWKQVMRVALGILGQAEKRLLSMRFESIVQDVKHRPSTLLCGDINQVLKRAARFKVTNSLMASLEDQYWRHRRQSPP